MANRHREFDYVQAERQKFVTGGLATERLQSLHYDEVHYVLYKYAFNLDVIRQNVPREVYKLAKKVKKLLDTDKPTTLSDYFQKFMAYNQILLIHEMIRELRNKDGPHHVNQIEQNLYEVQLTHGFCAEYKVPHKGVIQLTREGMGMDNAIRGQVVRFDNDTRIIRFSLSHNERRPRGVFVIRFEPCRFVFNARHFILQNGERMGAFNFWVNLQTISDLISREEFLQKRQQLMNSIPFSSNGFNREQREAITTIVNAHTLKVYNQNNVLLPYLVHGTPGTGRTVTLVEAVRLLMQQQNGEHGQQNHVLVCTPSNNLADLFATQLLQAGANPRHILRIHPFMRPVGEVPNELKAVSLIVKLANGKELFGIPPLPQLLSYRVVICTINLSVNLVLGKMWQSFTHIIVDNAGKISELDTLIPLVGLAGAETKIILAGFPQPLGPLEKIAYFRDNNFTKSMLERFMEIEFYANDPRTATYLPPIHFNSQQEESGENRDWNVGYSGETEALSENMVKMNEEETEEIQNALSAPLPGGSSQSDF